MATWAWFAIAAGTGGFVGIESWAWLRHGTSAVALAVVGGVALIQALVVVAVVGAIGLGLLAGVTGWDPAGLDDSTTADGAAARSACDPSYPDDCLDTNAADYDCDGGSGDGPSYVTDPISVTGADPYDLDRDGDGIGCATEPRNDDEMPRFARGRAQRGDPRDHRDAAGAAPTGTHTTAEANGGWT